jgi:hypothetical protein
MKNCGLCRTIRNGSAAYLSVLPWLVERQIWFWLPQTLDFVGQVRVRLCPLWQLETSDLKRKCERDQLNEQIEHLRDTLKQSLDQTSSLTRLLTDESERGKAFRTSQNRTDIGGTSQGRHGPAETWLVAPLEEPDRRNAALCRRKARIPPFYSFTCVIFVTCGIYPQDVIE